MRKLLVILTGAVASLGLLATVSAQEAPTSDENENQDVAQAETGTETTEATDTTATEDAQATTEATADAEVAVAEDEAEVEAEGSLIDPFSVSFSMSNTFSLGAVFRDEFTAQNYDLMSFGLGVSYATPVPSLSASLSANVSKFLTESGGSTRQREARFGDIGVRASYGSIINDEEYTGLNLSGSLGFRIPTSDVSQFTNLYTAMSVGLGLSRSFGDLSLSYGLGVGKNFHEYTSIVADLTDYQLDVIARDGGVENVGEALVALDAGVLTEWSLSHSLTLSYGWFEGFSTSISFGFADYWTYDNGTISAQDDLTSPFASPGRGHGQSMSGDIDVSYSFLDYFSTSLTLSTSQEPLTADNQSVRFPFFDFETGNLSNTSLSLSLAASY